MAFDLRIITPEGTFLEDRVDSLTVKLTTGYRTILKGHYPLFGTLDFAPMHLMKGDNTMYYSLHGGVLRVNNDSVTIITSSIEHKNDIDLKRAMDSKARAEKRLSERLEETDIKRAELSLKRALSRIKTYNL